MSLQSSLALKLAFQGYNKEDVLKAKLALLTQTGMIDLAIDTFKELNGDSTEPKGSYGVISVVFHRAAPASGLSQLLGMTAIIFFLTIFLYPHWTFSRSGEASRGNCTGARPSTDQTRARLRHV